MCVCTHVLCPRPDNFKSSNKLSKTTTKASRTRKTILSFNLVTYTYIHIHILTYLQLSNPPLG